MNPGLRKRISSIQNTQRSLRWGFYDAEDGTTVVVVCFYHRPYNRVAHYLLFDQNSVYLVDDKKEYLFPVDRQTVPGIIKLLKQWYPSV